MATEPNPYFSQELAQQMLAALRLALDALDRSYPIDRTPDTAARHRIATNAVHIAVTDANRAIAKARVPA